ncbi:hypothetical protein HPB50_001252 [Hyalomma asiaticum]|uniref:Uncharacterized protein n=1 Tax=Hyalomma asiaticum TaxID=266040 RepID=A0ACB7S050_HYAAI|nr:hypothetical protein HPB50_001252 [Hyalomma asiaticum]
MAARNPGGSRRPDQDDIKGNSSGLPQTENRQARFDPNQAQGRLPAHAQNTQGDCQQQGNTYVSRGRGRGRSHARQGQQTFSDNGYRQQPPGDQTLRPAESPAGTSLDRRQTGELSSQPQNQSSCESLAKAADVNVAPATIPRAQQPFRFNQALQPQDHNHSVGPHPQSLQAPLQRLKIDRSQDTLQPGPPQRSAGRGRGRLKDPNTQNPPGQHGDCSRQPQQPTTNAPLPQPAVPIHPKYPAYSSLQYGNAPPSGSYPGYDQRSPSFAPRVTAASSLYPNNLGGPPLSGASASRNFSDERRHPGASQGSPSFAPRGTAASSSLYPNNLGASSLSGASTSRNFSDERRHPGASQVPSPRQYTEPGASGRTAVSAYGRPNFGGITPLTVQANHFRMDIKDTIVVYQYRVDISELDKNEQPIESIKGVHASDKLRAFSEFAKKVLVHCPIFDGQEAFYSTKDLGKSKTETVCVPEPGGPLRKYSVAIRDRKELQHCFSDLGQKATLRQECVQALDIAIRCALSHKRERVGRLVVKTTKYTPQEILQTYRGILTSVRPGQSEIFLNADTLETAFYVPGQLGDLWRRCGGGPKFQEFLDNLVGLKVRVTHLPYTCIRTVEYVAKSADQQELEENCAETVAQYFQKKYGALRYPNLPCLKVVGKRTCYYPLEKCHLLMGQRGAAKPPGRLMDPHNRFKLAIDVAKELKARNTAHLDAFVTNIDDSPVRIEAKRLPEWTEKPAKTEREDEIKWIIVNMCGNVDAKGFIDSLRLQLRRKGTDVGVRLQYPNILTCDSVDQMFTNIKDKVGLALIVLPNKNSVHYPRIKYLAETRYGLITQCVALQVKDPSPSYCGNLMRKIKAKLGLVDKAMPRLINDFKFEDVLVMGADVSHHGPNELQPSVAAIVASIDDRASRYVASIRLQQKSKGKKRVEIIEEMEVMVKDLFEVYKNENRMKSPKAILFYRDGVSEGEFAQVYSEELTLLKGACKQAFRTQPSITFLTVQKRHRTRFALESGAGSGTKLVNVPPGTVVDTTITRPRLPRSQDREFFMCSHTPIRGTARPAHYHVIGDDNAFDDETLQKITYSLCHVYARCDKPVSIPTPVYYAHLAAARASCYMRAHAQNTSTAVNTNDIQPKHDMKKQMFFI